MTASIYLGIVLIILVEKHYAFSSIIQAISIFVLTSGYLVPIVLRISQLRLESGMKPWIRPSGAEDDYMNRSLSNDMIGDVGFNVDESIKPIPNHPEDYFGKYYGERSTKMDAIQEKAKKPNCCSLIVAYLALSGVLLFYAAIIYGWIRRLF